MGLVSEAPAAAFEAVIGQTSLLLISRVVSQINKRFRMTGFIDSESCTDSHSQCTQDASRSTGWG